MLAVFQNAHMRSIRGLTLTESLRSDSAIPRGSKLFKVFWFPTDLIRSDQITLIFLYHLMYDAMHIHESASSKHGMSLKISRLTYLFSSLLQTVKPLPKTPVLAQVSWLRGRALSYLLWACMQAHRKWRERQNSCNHCCIADGCSGSHQASQYVSTDCFFVSIQSISQHASPVTHAAFI